MPTGPVRLSTVCPWHEAQRDPARVSRPNRVCREGGTVPRPMIRPACWLPLLLLVIGNAGPLVSQVLERPPVGDRTPTLYFQGPSWVSAAGFIPTRIIIKWNSVPNAAAYQIFRTNPVEPRHMAYELSVDALASFREMDTGYYYNVNWPVDETSLYTYDIQAVFVDAAGSRTLSARSPSASAKSAPWLAPANLNYTISLYNVPGKLILNLTWDPVPNAGGYLVSWGTQQMTVFNATKLSLDNISPKDRFRVCVSTIYRPEIRNDQVNTCIQVKT